jgi:DNA-binding MarR family transcriptional regulator
MIGDMMNVTSIDRLDQSFAEFMRFFFVHINPILHRAEFLGRSYSENQIVVVMALHVVGPLRPTDLSRGLSLQKGSLTPILRKLRELGLIEKQVLPGEERSYLLRLTGGGRSFVQHLEILRRKGFEALFQEMDPDEVQAAAHGISLLTRYLQGREEAACSRNS